MASATGARKLSALAMVVDCSLRARALPVFVGAAVDCPIGALLVGARVVGARLGAFVGAGVGAGVGALVGAMVVGAVVIVGALVVIALAGALADCA